MATELAFPEEAERQALTVVETSKILEEEEDVDPRTEELIEALEEQSSALTAVNISDLPVAPSLVQRICKCVKRRASASGISSINLMYTDIGNSGVDKLATVLKATTTVKTLSLVGSLVGSDGATSLSKALQEANSSITALDLSENNLQDAGAQKIARALEKNTALKTLKLCYCKIGTMGCARLALALGEGAPEFVRPANAPPGRKVKPDTKINANKALTTLNLEGNDIGKQGAERLANMLTVSTTLKSLDISNCMIEDNGACHLALSLKKNSTLTDLSIRNNELTQFSSIRLAAALESNTALLYLDMMENAIGRTGIESFRTALDTNTTLKELLRN